MINAAVGSRAQYDEGSSNADTVRVSEFQEQCQASHVSASPATAFAPMVVSDGPINRVSRSSSNLTPIALNFPS